MKNGDKLINRNKPRERVYFDKVATRGGVETVFVDYIFSDSGKLRQDKRYITPDDFASNYKMA